jgi:AcrR family transcriptional regulator
MNDRRTPPISSRKSPRQARSAQLVADILAAAAQVLVKEGAHRFTTARVAEKAGVSVGSLYQYFTNKAAILFRLQTDEWQQTGSLLRSILEDQAKPPLDRLRDVVHAFVQSECEEAEMRIALGDAAPLYRDAPEALEPRLSGTRTMQVFLRELLPDATEPVVRTVAGDLIMMTLSDVGKSLSEQRLQAADISTYGDAMADMFCAYLEKLRECRLSGTDASL